MKAKEQAKVAGIINSNGLFPPAIAIVASMGRKILAVAVLELTSVKKIIMVMTQISTNNKENELTKAICSPIQTANPVAAKLSAMA